MNYLAQLYCICVLWTNMDIDQIQNVHLLSNNGKGSNVEPPVLIWLKYENETNVNDLVRMGIDSGCQAFITTRASILKFFDAFDNVRFTAENRYHLMHVFVLSTPTDRIQTILSHPVVKDLPNILIVVPSDDRPGSFDLITSQYVGRFNNSAAQYLDSFDASKGTFIHNASLFPDKLANLQGLSIRVALFNYIPYAVWKLVVRVHWKMMQISLKINHY